MIYKASDIFTPDKFSQQELDKIWKVASGRLIYFNPSPDNHRRTDPIPYILSYARQEKFKQDLPFSLRRFYQILKNERQNLCQERVMFYQQQGLTMRQIARLFNISLTTLQKILNKEQQCLE